MIDADPNKSPLADQLSKAMLAKRMAVHEEAIVATLLPDLATCANSSWQHAID
jgi:hypothetical protein